MDAVLGFLQQPVVLTILTIGWGLVVKYHPRFGKVPNALIPYFNAAIALLVNLAGPAPAHAAGGGWFHAGVGFFAPILQAGWQAVISSLTYEVFLKTGLSKVLVKNTPA